MKLLLILGSDASYKTIVERMKGQGIEFIRYSHILKAMDNIDEIDPAGIILSARDYPRHWKAFVQFTRSARSREDCPIILLKGNNFSQEDITKGLYIGVNGIVDESLETESEFARLSGIIERYTEPEEKIFYPGGNRGRFNFVAAVPGADKALVTGEVKAISPSRLSFLPDNADSAGLIEVGAELDECSLRAGDTILNPVCRLTGKGRNLSLEFVSFPPDEKETLKKVIGEFTAT